MKTPTATICLAIAFVMALVPSADAERSSTRGKVPSNKLDEESELVFDSKPNDRKLKTKKNSDKENSDKEKTNNKEKSKKGSRSENMSMD
jgi:hypothetical protein